VIRSLTLTNFMAHASTELVLAPGLNVLCGPNNTGKSAVVEALRCLTQNPAPRHVIRHGAAEARVAVELDGGWQVAWVRRKGYALYEVTLPGASGPQVYAKLGRSGVPPEVAELLKLSPVFFEKGESVDVHLGDQRHPIFLLDQPGSLLADFLASATESAHLMSMQDLLRDKVRKARIETRALEEGTIRAEGDLDRLSRLPELSLSLEGLRFEGQVLKEAVSAAPVLDGRLARVRNLAVQTSRLAARAETLSRISPPPGLAPSSALAGRLAALAGGRDRAASARGRAASLAGLAAPPAISAARSRVLAGLLERTLRLRALMGRAGARLEILDPMAPPPAVADPAPLAGLIASMESLAARLAKTRAWLAGREEALSGLAETIAARLAEVGECPLCGAGLDAGRFLNTAGKAGEGGRGTS
jgi:exonuclease SbcC